MTSARYRTYRALLETLEALGLKDAERETLRDAAEGFLLAPSDGVAELSELGVDASIVLDRAVGARRITQRTANELMSAIEACGPQGVVLLAA